ncbi:BTE binding protein 4 [Dendryphion nanum]|uniref:BTE binding protein 4 n=1 Tax=Dendryphion nanum TaxID=256645 RepID=A0A9P9IGU3_9PLEO|nr:BTE binding protein 4 [Dendryphion nanum]
MLSTNQPSSIQRRRTQHRRQQSTPAAFEAPRVRPLPANIQQRRQQRTGMSLDLRGLDLESVRMPEGPLPHQIQPTPGPMEFFSPREDSTQFMQVAQPHSQPQPGLQEPFMHSPVQQSLPSPRTPHRTLRAQSPQQPPLSPSKAPPTDQQLKELHEHIQSVYGSCGQVFINILPTPTPTPHKPAQIPTHAQLDAVSLPPAFRDMADINLGPTSSAMTFDFENPDLDMGYESSSYYTSDAVSPSPISSPHQRTMHTFLEGIEEHPAQEMSFSQLPGLLPSHDSMPLMNSLPLSPVDPSIYTELEMDASIEYTGISPEEVQRYISEQDLATNKWTCLYPDCGKVFGRRENIRSHVQTHLGDRQFRCSDCGKCFVRQHDLKRHSKIHTGNKPYKCPCSAGFARQDALTRHRQRGMCVGGFPDAVRRQAKRGRPKKNRPDMEERVTKAKKTRRAVASVASSVSAGSPFSETQSTGQSPSTYEEYGYREVQVMSSIDSQLSSYAEPLNTSSNPFSFQTASSSYAENSQTNTESFASSGSFTGDVASLNILQQLSQTTHTPPMSPANSRPLSSGSSIDTNVAVPSGLCKGSSTPSQSSIQSNPFSTPPTSPVEPKDDLDELFNSLPDSSCSQFDLEMKAMDDFTSLDSSYDFLNFEV